jgi:hypothetical protein
MKTLEEGNSSTANDMLLLLFQTVWELFFVIPAAAVDMIQELSSLNYFSDACMWSRSIVAVEEFLQYLLHKNSDRSSIWDWQEHAGVHKSTPEIEDDGNRMNSWILHSQCAHNYQSYDILSPLFRPTHIMWALWEHDGNIMWTLWERHVNIVGTWWEFHGDVIRTWEFHHANVKKKTWY